MPPIENSPITLEGWFLLAFDLILDSDYARVKSIIGISSDETENEYSKVRRPPAPPIRNNSNVIYDLICSENNYDEVPPLEGETF